MSAIVRPAMTLFALLTLVTGIIYPLLVAAVAGIAFPHQAQGSFILRNGRAVGSELIGQQFSDPKYFWGRPSATAPQPYNGTASNGSNLGPLNPALIDAAKARIQALQQSDPDNKTPIPVDLVTASASGLDPHISIAAARYQLVRVARARGFSVSRLQELLAEHERARFAGILGEPRVNVLELNLALDDLAARASRQPVH